MFNHTAPASCVTEQLRSVKERIAELHRLERQLTDVLRGFEKTTSPSDAKGCSCLDGMSGD